MNEACVIILVLDSVGIGAAPDAAAYGDDGANTLVNMSRAVPGGLCIPTLQALGLGNIHPDTIEGCPAVSSPQGVYGYLRPCSAGKDTTTGHWEMIGVVLDTPFATFPNGFSEEFMKEWAAAVGVEGWLHNKPASGTEIIRALGEEHCATGYPIVYTSADSVFQIAAHEEVFGLERLYAVCEKTREMVDALSIGRVIARPFIGEDAASFTRTSNRHDYSMTPPEPHALTRIRDAGHAVNGIGKIYDIFAGSGITDTQRTRSNEEGMRVLMQTLDAGTRGLIFVNLVEFDMMYGHRRDPQGYAACLAAFDEQLAELLPRLGRRDALIITADHGLDPTYAGTDHTRENVPFIAYSPGIHPHDVGERIGFTHVGATACALLDVALAEGWHTLAHFEE